MKKTSGIILLALLVSSSVYAQLDVELNKDQQALIQSDDPILASNKKLMFDFYLNVFQTHDMSTASDYMAEDYMQHNPMVPTGRAAFTGFFGSLPQVPKSDHIDDLVSMVAERDLVVLSFRSVCKNPQGGTYTTTWFDMFRIEEGLIAEHWDYGTLPQEGNAPDCGR